MANAAASSRYNIATRFSEEEALFGSDTRGETTLAGSPYFGYDTVNGAMPRELHPVENEGLEFRRVFSLYHNVNLFNTLKMIAALAGRIRGARAEKSRFYIDLAARLQTSLQTKFVDKDGVFPCGLCVFRRRLARLDRISKRRLLGICLGGFGRPVFSRYSNGAQKRAHGEGGVAQNPALWLLSVEHARPFFARIWNGQRRLHRYAARRSKRCAADSTKFPLRGALTEYQKDIESWRGLPFSAGSFLFSLAGSLLQSLPAGLAVRAGGLVTEISDFRFRTARIGVETRGEGEGVASWTINGREVNHTLQIPENMLRNGQNLISVKRGEYGGFRLYSSSATLREVEMVEGGCVFHFTSPVACEVVFENFERAKSVTVQGSSGALDIPVQNLPATSLSVLSVPASGDFRVTTQF
jgi:hypothetical protein